MNKNRIFRKKRIMTAVIIVALLAITPFIINKYMINSANAYIINEELAKDVKADCILVLGAGLLLDGTPNIMLQDRLDKGIALYKAGVAPKLLLSGDNGQERYDEVNAKKCYVWRRAVPYKTFVINLLELPKYNVS